MPAIITAHIAQSSARCGPSQFMVIIHAAGPRIDPYMSRAIRTIHAQLTDVVTSSTATSNARGYRSTASTAVRRRRAGWTSGLGANGVLIRSGFYAVDR